MAGRVLSKNKTRPKNFLKIAKNQPGCSLMLFNPQPSLRTLRLRRLPGRALIPPPRTGLNLICRNLFEQFRRITNFYFLLLAIISVIIESPVSPVPNFLALGFVILTTAIKQGYEDFKRHRADRVINHRLVTRIEANGIQEIQSSKIQVGDVICVEDGDEFPCDMLILSSSNPNGKVTIMTANLDGETNLKTHSAPHVTRHLTQPHLLNNMRAQIECENPNPDLNRFQGRINLVQAVGVQVVSLGLNNMAFRGTQLKNTEFVYGCALYTGADTKMSQNSRSTSNKFSSVEVKMNKYLLFFLLVVFLEVLVSTLLDFYIGKRFKVKIHLQGVPTSLE